MSYEPLPPAELTFEECTPYSATFGDTYFDRRDGLNEARHVFLRGNELPQRFADRTTFTILEMGFGTGLNMLATWQAHQVTASAGHVHYVALEKSPLVPEQMRKAWSPWPGVAELGEKLLAKLPHRLAGHHAMALGEKFTLHLLYGEAIESLATLRARIDAIYLDGFSPAKNPTAWSKELCKQLARLATPGCTLATYSVARSVRDTLVECGFDVARVAGHGAKRHMLVGKFTHPASFLPTEKPWFAYPQVSSPSKVAVIGGGIAGSATAYALASHGIQVEVFEADRVGAGASGAPVASAFPVPYAKASAYRDVHLAAFGWLSSLARRFSFACQPSLGRFLLEHHPQLRDDGNFPADLIRFDRHGGRDVAWVRGYRLQPKALLSALLSHPAIKVHEHCAATIAGDGVLAVGGKNLSFDAVVLAQGFTTPVQQGDLIPVRGQLTRFESGRFTGQETCSAAHTIWTVDGGAWVGGTHDRGETSLTPWVQSRAVLQDTLINVFPTNCAQPVDEWVGIRGATADRLPLVGPAIDAHQYQALYGELHHGRSATYPAPSHSGRLWWNTGHGSRGFTSGFLGAAIIASALTHVPFPLRWPLVEAMHPARFIMRRLRKAPAYRSATLALTPSRVGGT